MVWRAPSRACADKPTCPFVREKQRVEKRVGGCSSFKHPNECTHHPEHLRHDLRGVVPPSVHRNPSLAIKEGDLIVAVNGVLGSSGAMSAAMGAAKVLVLDVERASFASLPRARQDNPVLA